VGAKEGGQAVLKKGMAGGLLGATAAVVFIFDVAEVIVVIIIVVAFVAVVVVVVLVVVAVCVIQEYRVESRISQGSSCSERIRRFTHLCSERLQFQKFQGMYSRRKWTRRQMNRSSSS
jgi:hypothetical protein